jgi:hypothetical protein
MLRAFRIPLLITAASLALVLYLGGLKAAFIVAVLALLEISLSFDNAIVNAKVLGRMNAFWQRLFLTLGIAIAVFGMRLVFPLAIVSITGGVGPGAVIDMALNRPEEYAQVLTAAHPAIAAFGSMFLLMLFLDFIFAERKIKWLRRLEWGMARLGRLENLTVITALGALALAATFLAGDHAGAVLLAGVSGVLVYLGITSLTGLFEAGRLAEEHNKASAAKAVAKAGIFSFIYLEIIDASFSFDGVVGAFAITNQILLITVGLGIGAIFVRELTIYLVRRGTLAQYVYLEHGAHYGVGVLALILLASLKYEIPELVTGLVGIGFIVMAFLDSREYQKQHPEHMLHAMELPKVPASVQK